MAGTGLDGQIVVIEGSTVMPRAWLTCWAPAVTVMVNVDVPVAVAVPEISPVEEASVSPAGSVPLAIDQVYGGVPPVAASVAV